MTTPIKECRIWGHYAEGYSVFDPSKVVVTQSHRAGGGYVIPGSVAKHLTVLRDDEKARLTTWLIDQRLQGNERPIITSEILNYAIGRDRLPMHMRADRLLRYMASETNEAGEIVEMFVPSPNSGFPLSSNVLNAMAWSEATSPTESHRTCCDTWWQRACYEGLRGSYPLERMDCPLPRYEVTVNWSFKDS